MSTTLYVKEVTNDVADDSEDRATRAEDDGLDDGAEDDGLDDGAETETSQYAPFENPLHTVQYG